MYKYSKNWKELQQPLSIQMHNNWLIDELSPEIRKQFTLIQAALHFRRNQQPQREYAAMKERLEKDEWRTLDGGFGRFCELMKRYDEPERCIELLGHAAIVSIILELPYHYWGSRGARIGLGTMALIITLFSVWLAVILKG